MSIDIKLAYGMITAKAITNVRGGVLLPSGIELTEPIILALMKQGIQQVEVKEKEALSAARLAEKQRERIAYIEQLFARFHSPDMMEFKACLIKQAKS